MRGAKVGELLVYPARPVGGAGGFAQIYVGRGDREHGVVDADLVHECERLLRRPFGLGEPVDRLRVGAGLIKEGKVAGREHVRVDVDDAHGSPLCGGLSYP